MGIRKKMYKIGKLWTIVVIAIGTGIITSQSVSADQAQATSSTQEIQTRTIDQSAVANGMTVTPAPASASDAVNQNSATSSSTDSQASGATSSSVDSKAGSTTNSSSVSQPSSSAAQSDSQAASLKQFADQHANGYLYAPQISSDNGGYAWFEDGQLFTGFRFYMGTYYWFTKGIRENNSWHDAWRLTYYTDNNGRAVQGLQTIDGHRYFFGNDNTFYLRKDQVMTVDGQSYHSNNDGILLPWQGYISDPSIANGAWRWYEDGQLFTGFRYYYGTYYWFNQGIRQDSSWHDAWGLRYYTGADGRAVQGLQTIDGHRYYFGEDGTYYLRIHQGLTINGQEYNSDYDGVLSPFQGYISDPSIADGAWLWYEGGQLFTGFRYYYGTYYWFNQGVRQDSSWHEAWGNKYYTGSDGRAVQGFQDVDGHRYFFGNDGTYYLRNNGYFSNNGAIYFANNDGTLLTGDHNVYGNNLHFNDDGSLDISRLSIDFPHYSYNQNAEGAPEGCEGTSFQIALSAKGKSVPSLVDIYNRIGYGYNVPADRGFHGNPFGYGQWYTQTVFAAPLASALNGIYGVQTRDITGSTPADIIIQLLQWNPVITYIPWDLQITGGNNYHVQLITGYANGAFKIADPLPINHAADYWLSTSNWYYLNQNIQPVGFSSPRGMNVAVM